MALKDGISLKSMEANGMEVAYLEAGKGRLVMLLHGFPDTAYGYQDVMLRLADAGYRAVAPFLRGYAPTALAPDGNYLINTLAQDLIAQLEILGGGEKGFVVGHDWGGAILQYAANQSPDRFDRMVMVAMPHLGRFLLSPTWKQLKNSHYIFRFQFPGWAERKLPQDDFRWLRDVLLRRWSPGYEFSETELEPLLSEFAKPERMNAAIQYYRGLPVALTRPSTARIALGATNVPTLMLYGLDDGCFANVTFEQKNEERFTAGFERRGREGVGHFPQYEAPDWMADQLIEYFGEDK